MLRRLSLTLLGLLLAVTAHAGGRGGSSVGTASVCPLIGSSATPPATCNQCEQYFDTDADTNGSLLVCIGSNTWKDVDDDGAAGGGGDLSSNTSSSTPGKVAVFADGSGKLTRESTLTGVPLYAAGLPAANTPLTAISAVTPAADRVPYYTGPSAAAVTPLTSFIRTLLDDNDAAAARATLAAQVANAKLDEIIAGGATANYVNAAGAAQAGYVTTGPQVFAGLKSFTSAIVPPSYTVATLPAASGLSPDGGLVWVTDAFTQGSCTVGAGTFLTLCRDNGAGWGPPSSLSGGGGGATSFCALDDVDCQTPATGYVPVWFNGIGLVLTPYGITEGGGGNSYVTNVTSNLCIGGDCNPNAAHRLNADGGVVLNGNGAALSRVQIKGSGGQDYLGDFNALQNGIGLGGQAVGATVTAFLPFQSTSATPSLFTAALRAPVEIVTRTQAGSPHTLTSSDCMGAITSNRGASGPSICNLPAATAGLLCMFQLQAAQTIKLEPNGSDRIEVLTDTNGDSVTSDSTPGHLLTLYSPATGIWSAIGRDGVWADSN